MVARGSLTEGQHRRHHAGHLLLGGAAVTAYRCLDLLGGVGVTGKSALTAGEQDDAAGLPDGKGAACVLPEVEVLQRHHADVVLVDELEHLSVDGAQALLGSGGGARLNHATVERAQTPIARANHAVAGVRGSGVDAEHDHLAGFSVAVRTPATRGLPYPHGHVTGIDYAAEGLLDGLEGRAREERLELLSYLSEQQVPLEELRRHSEQGTLMFVPADRAIAGPERYTEAEVVQRSGGDAAFLQELRQAMGLAVTDPGEHEFTDADVEAARVATRNLQAGITREEILDVTRVLGRGLAQAAELMRSITLRLVLEPGLSERALAERFAQAAGSLSPTTTPLVGHMLTLHLRQMAEVEAINASERSGGQVPGSREIAVCFADLVGFTRVGEEVPPDELGRVARRLEALTTETVQRPVRLVKTIGDAAMLTSPDPIPLVDGALALVAAAEAEGRDFPQLRVGVALGPALNRGGDWYGRAVNLASRITGAARPGSVLGAAAVQEATPDAFAWSYAGERRLKGVREAQRLFRARPREPRA